MQFKQLSQLLVTTNAALYQQAVKAVNIRLTVRNWLFGYYIVNFEQHGEGRAVYGTHLLKELATSAKLVGISETGLKTFRQFYLAYPQISQTLPDQLQPIKKSKKSKSLILG